MFRVINLRTNEVKLVTTSLRKAYILQDQENNLEIGVGYEANWAIQFVEGDRVYQIEAEEL